MHSFQEYLSTGHGWLFFPAAILLGALHGLEPGHSKTMMAAFIVSIRGTILQAVLLGLSATISHTGVIWLLAFIGMRFSKNLNVESVEPYIQIGIGLTVIVMALWMFRRTQHAEGHSHNHDHAHGTHGGMLMNTGHGQIEVSVFETNTPPVFRLYFYDQKVTAVSPENPEHLVLKTVRPDGTTQTFSLRRSRDFLESVETIPEPHEFKVLLQISHHGHSHSYAVEFAEHDHVHSGLDDVAPDEFEDAHERAHAMEIQERFANRSVTTPQIILFGLTGGLIPCPGAFAVLLVCLQQKQYALGFTLVIAFSIGLAITLVAAGVLAAISVKQVAKHFSGFGKLVRKAPYASAIVMCAVAAWILIQGVRGLMH